MSNTETDIKERQKRLEKRFARNRKKQDKRRKQILLRAVLSKEIEETEE